MIREDLSRKEILSLLLEYQEYFLGIHSRAACSTQGKFQPHPADNHLYEQTVFYVCEMLKKNGGIEVSAYVRRYYEEKNMDGIKDMLKTAIAHEKTSRKMYWKTGLRTARKRPKLKQERLVTMVPVPLQVPDKVTPAWAWRHFPMSYWMGGLSAFATVFAVGYRVGAWFH